jgi:hypothetical protein
MSRARRSIEPKSLMHWQAWTDAWYIVNQSQWFILLFELLWLIQAHRDWFNWHWLHRSQSNQFKLNWYHCDRCNQCQLNRSQYASIRSIIRFTLAGIWKSGQWHVPSDQRDLSSDQPKSPYRTVHSEHTYVRSRSRISRFWLDQESERRFSNLEQANVWIPWKGCNELSVSMANGVFLIATLPSAAGHR